MRAAKAASLRGRIEQPQQLKGENGFREVFQYVLLNNTGITMTNLPFSRENMERELERASRLHGGCGDLPDGKFVGELEEGNTPGEFVVLEDVVVTSEASPSAAEVARVAAGVHVKVLEVVLCPEDKVLRGRIGQPAGWLPIVNNNGRRRWARKKGFARWSDDAEQLQGLIQKLGPRNVNLSSEAFVKSFFTHLLLPDRGLKRLDDDTTRFSQLTYLDVSRNPLTSVDHLPPGLKFLKAYNTQITSFECPPVPSLDFLGVGHCPLGMQGVSQAVSRFPGLLSLDLSYTLVDSLDAVTGQLTALSRLRHLCLAGSPACLFPFHRIRTLCVLPELKLLDGFPVAEEERDDARLLQASVQAAATRYAPLLRLALQPQSLRAARLLFEPAAGEVLMARRTLWAEAANAADAAAAEAREAGNEAEETERAGKARAIRTTAEGWDKEGKDTVLEACKGGTVSLYLQLPDGEWAATAEMRLDPEAAEAAEEGGAGLFDTLDLSRLKRRDGEPLLFEVDLADKGTPGQLCSWLRKGLVIKAFLRPAQPPNPEEAEEESAVPAKGGKANGRGSPNKGKPGAGGKSKETPEPEENNEPPQEEFAIGGGVLPLDSFFWRAETGITQQIREAADLPSLPQPWRLPEVPKAHLAPQARWLDPAVQVPLAKLPGKAPPAPTATLALKVTLYAPEQEEEPPPEVPQPKAKGKSKK